MGHFGFSYIGLIYLLLLFLPNILWTRHKPPEYDGAARRESRALVAVERAGEVCVTVCALVFADFNWRAFSLWSLWLIVSALLMVLYEVCWLRYFRTGCTWAGFYGSLGIIPVPLATLPVAAFLLLGVYGKVVWMIAAALILGVGHIGIHLGHAREMVDPK